MKKILFLCLAPFLLLASCSRQAVSSESQEPESSSVSSAISVSSSSSSSSSLAITSSSSEESSLSISEHEHTFKNTWSHNSTQHWHASTCGHDVKADLANHSYKTSTTPATFDSEGYTTYTCSICGYSYKKTTGSKKQHTYATTWSNDANYHWHACTDSGYTSLKQDTALHTYRDVVTQPTGQSGGYTTRTCTVCGYSYQANQTPALTYTISWLNDDRSILETDNNVKYGATPFYNGATPSKANPEDHYLYAFTGWDKEITSVTSNCEYVATYERRQSGYFYTYLDDDGNVISKITTDDQAQASRLLNEKPAKPSTNEYDYAFIKWNEKSNDGQGAVVYQAIYDISTKGLIVSGDTVTGYTGSAKDVVIPQKWNGTEIKKVAAQAFRDNKDITSVVVPDSVLSIGDAAFFGCNSLTSLTLPFVGGSPTENRFLGYIFGASSYENASSYIPESLYSITVSDACQSLDTYSFAACSNLTRLSLPFVGRSPNLTDRKFSDIFGGDYLSSTYKKMAPSFWDVTIRGYSIPDYAFNSYISNNSSYPYGKSIHNINIGNDVPTVGKYAFSGYTGANGYDNCSYVGNDENPYLWLINANSSMTSCTIHSRCKGIASCAFKDCNLLKFLTDSSNLTYIGEEAFCNCIALTTATLNDNVTYIGDKAFYNCDALSTIELPKNVEYIGEAAFASSAYKTINYRGTIDGWVSISGTGKALLEGNVHLFLSNSARETTSISIPAGITEISDYAFYNCSSIRSVTFSNTVTKIGELAFHNCSSLSSTRLPNSLKTIGKLAFRNCSSLTSMVVPSSVTSMGAGIFQGCTSMESVTLPYITSCIGRYFYYFDTSMYYEQPSHETIVKTCNQNMPSSLKKVVISEGCESLPSLAFQYCYNLTSVSIPSTVTLSDTSTKNLFQYCSNLSTLATTLRLATTTTNLCPDSKTSLRDVIIQNGTQHIGENAFYNCTNLASIIIPNTIVSIENNAFGNCTSLTSVKYLGTEEEWNGIRMGTGNENLTNVAIVFEPQSGGGSGSGGQGGDSGEEQSGAYVLDFSTKEVKHTNYGDIWTFGDATIAGGANNDGGWAFVKMGAKSATLSSDQHPGTYITTNNAVSYSVKSVSMKFVGKCYNQSDEKVSVKIESYSDANFTTKVAETLSQEVPAITTNSGTETLTFTFSTAQNAEIYYKIVFDVYNTTTYNGVVALESITFNAAE